MIYNLVIEYWYPAIGVLTMIVSYVVMLNLYPKENSMDLGMLAMVGGILWGPALLASSAGGILWCLAKGIEFLVRGKWA